MQVSWKQVEKELLPLLAKSQSVLNEIATVAVKFISTEKNPIEDEDGVPITFNRIAVLAAEYGISKGKLFDKVSEKMFGTKKPAPERKTEVQELASKVARTSNLIDSMWKLFEDLSHADKVAFYNESGPSLKYVYDQARALYTDAKATAEIEDDDLIPV